MRGIKNEAQHYLKTKVLGAYETTDVSWVSDSTGAYHRSFEDTFITTDESSHIVERTMDINGRRYEICSVFPISPQKTPTQKLLEVIDIAEK